MLCLLDQILASRRINKTSQGGETVDLRSSDASGSIGRDGGERKLADGGGSSVVRGEAGGADAAASGADSEEIEVVVAVRVCSVFVLSTDGEPAGWMMMIPVV